MVFSSRCTRRLISSLGLAAILFAQVAVAAHACIALSPAEDPHVPVAMHQGNDAAPCHETDGERDNLCFRHCWNGAQTLDHQPSPLAIAAAVSVFHVDEPARVGVSSSSSLSYSHRLLARVTAPPLSVRHCCFRT